MKRLILASTSPRRKKIFEDLGLDFEIIPSSYEEKLENHVFSYKKIENLAYNKAFAVAKNIVSVSIVVGADTIVVLNNQILGKPKDRDEAFTMLKALSNKEHFVVTSICAIETPSMRKKIVSTTSYVTFNELSDEMINSYIENFKPFDKAGSYGIQELPHGFVKNIGGSFENIIGMCPKALNKTLSVFKH
ncbi:MAG: nucleoside triphosphate pyrophosphatase [Candidatus Gastranaerophilaceae bacterium]